MFLGEPEANKSQSSQVKVKAKVTANKSKSSQVKAKVTVTVKIQLMSAQFSPVQSSPAHLEFNLNPCQIHKFSTVQVEVNFNTLVRWTVISAQGSLIHCSS
jgi:transcriptional regulator of nitric oxide reductase